MVRWAKKRLRIANIIFPNRAFEGGSPSCNGFYWKKFAGSCDFLQGIKMLSKGETQATGVEKFNFPINFY